VQLDAEEARAIRSLELTEIALKKQEPALKVEARTRLLDAPLALRQEIYRWASLIDQRVAASNSPSMRWNPPREANPKTETMEMLFKKWEEQKGSCGLCQRQIAMPRLPGLL
jgi:hypothetical protein